MASKRKTPRRSVRKPTPNKQRSRARHAVLAKRKRPAQSTGGRRTLYPAIEPYNSGMLRVSGVHEIYYEECGNPNGKPALFVHGGPGAGCDNRARRFFDPDAGAQEVGCGLWYPDVITGVVHQQLRSVLGADPLVHDDVEDLEHRGEPRDVHQVIAAPRQV